MAAPHIMLGPIEHRSLYPSNLNKNRYQISKPKFTGSITVKIWRYMEKDIHMRGL